jgi:hypothetical protein
MDGNNDIVPIHTHAIAVSIKITATEWALKRLFDPDEDAGEKNKRLNGETNR